MRLTTKQIHWYLLDKGFIDMATMVNGGYQVTQSQTRNCIFKVNLKHQKSLFIKQLNSFDISNTYALQKDATCLWLIKNEPAYQKLSAYVPDYFGFDAEKQVLVTECINNSVNLDDYWRIKNTIPVGLLDQLADVLSSYHFKMNAELLNHRSVQFFPKTVPWVLNIAEMDASMANALLPQPQGPNPVVTTVVNNPEFKMLLSGLKNLWTYTNLIHGDIKGMNLLVHTVNDHEKIKVIDWEIADIGDPLWDVAGLIQGFIGNAILFGAQHANTGEVSLNDFADIWPMAEHIWQIYNDNINGGREADAAQLEKLMRYIGARLIQTSIEHNTTATTLQPNAIKLLQASYLVLSNSAALVKQLSNTYKLQSA